jgi:hypothetical protein
MALSDPVWREDIQDNEDYVVSLTKTLHNMVERLQYQGAHPNLVARMARLRDLSAQMVDELTELVPYFPPQ